jgi:GT2 family glycosyltransferase
MIPYYDIGGGQRGAQLAKTFSHLGYDVHYIYAVESSDGSNKSIYMPITLHTNVAQYSTDNFKMHLNKDSLCVFEAPGKEFLSYLRIASIAKIRIVYEHIDNWDTSLGSSFFCKDVFLEYLTRADYITATAEVLRDKLTQILRDEAITKEIIYSPNAVDIRLFNASIACATPPDMKFGQKTLLYYGSLWGEWFDWKLLKELAKDKRIVINLIGDSSSIREELPSNICLLGLKKQTMLPQYLRHCDFAIIPFKVDEIGKFVSPLKVFEYISMGKPVLSTKLPDIENYPNVFSSIDSREWLERIFADLAFEEYHGFIHQNNWYHRCNILLERAFGPRLEKSTVPEISIVVLNYNNSSVIFQCVDSLLEMNSYGYEIVVVDNNSTDGSYEQLLKNYNSNQNIKIVRNNKNGCSSGRNLGVSNSSGEYLLFLDSDQWTIDSHWLDVVISLAQEYPQIGAFSWAAGWLNKDRIAGPIVDNFESRAIRPYQLLRTDVHYLGSGGLYMSKELFVRIGGFDEKYDPTCFEDTDISMKVKSTGLDIAYCPYINIMHKSHSTTNSGSKAHRELMEINGRYFMKKWEDVLKSLNYAYYP